MEDRSSYKVESGKDEKIFQLGSIKVNISMNKLVNGH